MRRRTAAALGAVLLGVVTAPPLVPPAAAQELRPFDDCEQLREWYVDAALPMVGPWGLGWPGYYGRDGGIVPVAQDARAAVGSGDTGTNVQEVGVDEPDVAKTSGDLVVHLDRGDVVLTDVGGDEPRQLSRVELPRGLQGSELLLVDETVVVFGEDGHFRGVPTTATTHLLTVDITDPAAPRIEQDDRIDGSLLSAREYDGTIRAVISTGAPVLDFVHPTRNLTAREATRENRRIVRETTVEDWLPEMMACTDVRHPVDQSGLGTISVVTFDAATPGDRSATAVTAGGELVYSSTDRVYIATAHRARPRTQVHAFAIDGSTTEYVASGDVPGTVRDRWSFSEYDGLLRVATALGSSWAPRENAVVVLEERGSDLVEVGRVDGLGINEQIQSVRWFGDLAIVVTFRQVDPLYTVDLSDPSAPRVVGELKIRGFSSYLHPVGDDRLLGLGQDATLRGSTLGAQAALFDISDLTEPRRSGTTSFDRHTEFSTAWDSRAFTYLPGQDTALAPVQSYRNGRTRIAILRVNPDGTLTRTLSEPVAGWGTPYVRTLPLDDGRVALIVRGDVELLAV